MASFTIVDENGQSKKLSQWKINDINIVQTTGDAIDKVMSQKAVTDAINYAVNSFDCFDCGEY